VVRKRGRRESGDIEMRPVSTVIPVRTPIPIPSPPQTPGAAA
jgi:hypothetical protein